MRRPTWRSVAEMERLAQVAPWYGRVPLVLVYAALVGALGVLLSVWDRVMGKKR